MGVQGQTHWELCCSHTLQEKNKTQGEGAEKACGREAGREWAVCKAAVTTASWHMNSIFLVAFFSKPSYLQGSRICRPLWALLIIGSGGKWEFCSVLLRTWSPGIATCLTPSHFSPYWSSLSVQPLSYYIILTMKPLECKGTSIRVVSFHNCSRVPLNWNGFY